MLSLKSLKKLYYALIHPHLLYCCTVYGFTRQSNIRKLFIKQKQAVRVITKSRYNAHTEPLFYMLEILPLEDLITHQKLTFMHSIAHKYSAVEFVNFFPNLFVELRRQGLRNDCDFFVPRTNSTFITKMPFINFPLTWNALDSSFKSISSRNSFKSVTKMSLLDNYANFRCNKPVCVSCIPG